MVVSLVPLACLRPLLTDEAIGDGGSGDEGMETDTTLGATGADEPTGSESGAESSSDDGEPSCHPSYQPCLPLVDDLNCPEVVALGAAPVTVVGPDDYGLDADGDGIGCEP